MSSDRAYVAGLLMLGRRELSEAQVRQRLARRGYEDDEVDSAVARLLEERALDDRRVANAIAHTETRVRGRGRMRVKRQIEAAGISTPLAQEAVDAVLAELDADELLLAALEKRLRGRPAIADDREFQRLYRYLVTQGFDVDRVLAILRSRRR
jgi:regulatory protein